MKCNQCMNEMEYSAQLKEVQIPVCSNPNCPNFGLLQISSERMAEHENK
jgi:hypothetical protein